MRPAPPTSLLPLLVLLGLVGTAAGCGEDFPPFNRIQELRVLAIRSDPVAPAPGETTTLSALIFTPDPDPTITYAWSWCPLAGAANDGYPCEIDEAELAALAGGAGQSLPPYNLGTGATAQLPHTISSAVLEQLCTATGAAVAGLPIDLGCDGGFPVQIQLTVKTASDEVKAIRRLRLRRASDTEPNTNPRVDGVFVVTRDEADNETSAVPITDTPDVTLFRAEEALLRAVVPPESAEPYTGKDDNRQPIATKERLSLAWMIETGDTKNGTTNYVEGLNTLAEAMKNEWEPGRVEDYARSTARLFLVVRDNREGVAWRSGIVQLGAPR
jgi:hypothetical protein